MSPAVKILLTLVVVAVVIGLFMLFLTLPRSLGSFLGLKTCVVDTGSPLTFFYDAVGEYVLDGTSHRAAPLNGIMILAVPQQSDIEGLPTFAVSFNGHETMAAFDSGAMYPFISTRLANEINLPAAHSRFSDFHPGYGSFEAELHAGSIAVAGVELGVCDIATAPYYDSILGLLGVSAFIGTNALRDSTILLSYSRSEVFISATEN